MRDYDTMAAELDRGESRTVELVDASSVVCQPIRWLWPGWLARGKLHIIAGAPGTGKTTIATAMAAALTSGAPFPDGYRSSPGRVLIWSGEDDIADVLVPRLRAAGADLSRVMLIGDVDAEGVRHPFDPGRDVPLLVSRLAAEDDIAMIVVDPLVSAVTGDSHKNAETRRSLAPLIDLATQRDAALLGITHYSKGTQGREPLERVSGSLAFGAVARLVYGTVRQKDENGDGDRYLLARIKSNIGPDGGAFEYVIEQATLPDGIETNRVQFGAAVEGSARDLIGEAESDPDDAAQDAGRFLASLLSDGPLDAKAVYAQAESAGYSRDQMKRAKRRAGVIAVKIGGAFGRSAQSWKWQLPPEGSDFAEGSTQNRPLPSGESAPFSAEAAEL